MPTGLFVLHLDMGVKSGGTGGPVHRSRKISGGPPPPEIKIFHYLFYTHANFAFSNIFKIKCPKSEEKFYFGVRGLSAHESVPQTKFGGDAPAF